VDAAAASNGTTPKRAITASNFQAGEGSKAGTKQKGGTPGLARSKNPSKSKYSLANSYVSLTTAKNEGSKGSAGNQKKQI
jgi:hypothetical protein